MRLGLLQLVVGILLTQACSPMFGQEPPVKLAPQREAIQESIESRAERWIDAMVLVDSDTNLENGFRVMKRGSADRIQSAFQELKELGRPAWAILLKHFDDKRESMAWSQTIGPHTVAGACYHVIRSQIVVYPKGYPDSKLSADGYLSTLFAPSFAKWIDERKEKSLLEIQVEIIEWVIDQEVEIQSKNPNAKSSISVLEDHLERLRKQLAEEAKAKSAK